MKISFHVERCDETKITRGPAIPPPPRARRLRHGILPASHEIGGSRSRARSHVAASAMTNVFSVSGLSKLATVVAPLRPRAACRSIKRDPADAFGLDQL